MQKGKTAENIVKEMFESAGFKVIRYGYEHTVPSLADKENLITGRASDYIRHQPDLIVVNEHNEAFFVEVKFRSYKIADREIFNYPNCYVILLTKYGIYAQSTRFIHKIGSPFVHLNKMPPFRNIPQSIIETSEWKLRRKLGNETLISQLGEMVVEKITKKKLEQYKPSIVYLDKQNKVYHKGENNISKK